MFKVAALGVALVTAFAVQSDEPAQEKKEAAFSAKCPMSGAPAKKDKFVIYNGKKAYFCCSNCVKKFDTMTAKVNRQLVSTGQVKQSGCPFSGGKVKAETAIKVGGASVAFCCGNCKKRAEAKKGDEQITMLFGGKAMMKGFKPPKKKKVKKANKEVKKNAVK